MKVVFIYSVIFLFLLNFSLISAKRIKVVSKGIETFRRVNGDSDDIFPIPTSVKKTSSTNLNLKKQIASRGVGFLFVFSIMRLVAVYDEILLMEGSLLKKLVFKLTTGVLFFINVLATALQFFRPLQFKNQLKFVMFLNTIREIVDLIINIFSALIAHSRSASDMHYGKAISDFFWMCLFLSISKSRWVFQSTTKKYENL